MVSAAAIKPPPDKGLAQMAGIGPEAATEFGQTRVPVGVTAYDETVISEFKCLSFRPPATI